MLEIRLLGSFYITLDGEPLLAKIPRKTEWLLALLILKSPREIERSWLAETVWPDSEYEQALDNLRHALTQIRQALALEAYRLQTPERESKIRFDLADAHVDLIEFRRAIARGDSPSLETALSLYHGALLEGCNEDWVFLERTTAEEAFRAALETLGAEAITGGHPQHAVHYLRRSIKADPYRESAHRSLMRALADCGDHAAVVKVYADLKKWLLKEDKASPEPETEALFRELQQRKQSVVWGKSVSHSSMPPGSLPVPLTDLLAREPDIKAVAAWMEKKRLVTLTGMGGMGKTRLAIEVGRREWDRRSQAYPDGVWYVELASLSKPDHVTQAVAQKLGIKEEASRSLQETLQEFLAPRSLLLILDNCEHLVEAVAGALDRLLEACPGLHVLATSRTHLRVRGERVYKLAPLNLPPMRWHEATLDNDLNILGRLREYGGPRLFLERAEERNPVFPITPSQAVAVAEICRRLDGIPLAIELAAAMVRSLSVDQIYERLTTLFDMLHGGGRTALPHQKTLRATIDWSYDRLTSQEKTILRSFAAFAGGWTLEAAEFVGISHEVEAGEVLGLLTSLGDQSLIEVQQDMGHIRYRLLEPIRQYALEKSEATGESNRVRERHQAFFVKFVEIAEAQMQGPEQAGCLQRLEQEQDNLRSAMRWSNKKEALNIAASLGSFWEIRGSYTEGIMHLEEVLKAPENQKSESERAKALRAKAKLTACLGGYAEAEKGYAESLEIWRELGDRQGEASIYQEQGKILQLKGKKEQARVKYQLSLDIRTECHDEPGKASSMHDLGRIYHVNGDHEKKNGDTEKAKKDYEEAHDLFMDSRAIHEKSGNIRGLAASFQSLGGLAQSQAKTKEDYRIALVSYNKALDLWREIGDKLGTAWQLYDLGACSYLLGDTEAALKFYHQSLSIHKDLVNKHGIVSCSIGLAECAQTGNDLNSARAYYETALTILRAGKDKSLLAGLLYDLGQVVSKLKENETASAMLQESLAIHSELRNNQGIAAAQEALTILNAH